MKFKRTNKDKETKDIFCLIFEARLEKTQEKTSERYVIVVVVGLLVSGVVESES